jgi:hypothetical protein
MHHLQYRRLCSLKSQPPFRADDWQRVLLANRAAARGLLRLCLTIEKRQLLMAVHQVERVIDAAREGGALFAQFPLSATACDECRNGG